MDDKTIVKLFFARDERAIGETRKKYGGYCYSIARSILRSHEDAEECVADAYLAAWNAIPPTNRIRSRAFSECSPAESRWIAAAVSRQSAGAEIP